jgi:hypothetical protein
MIRAIVLALLAVGAYVVFAEHESSTVEVPSPSFAPAVPAADLATV